MNCSFAEALIPLMTNPHRYLTSNGQKNLTSIACRHLAFEHPAEGGSPGPVKAVDRGGLLDLWEGSQCYRDCFSSG